MTLTKQDLIENVSKNLRVPQNIGGFDRDTAELMKSTLASGEDLVISP
jgi:hypothetical protein